MDGDHPPHGDPVAMRSSRDAVTLYSGVAVIASRAGRDAAQLLSRTTLTGHGALPG